MAWTTISLHGPAIKLNLSLLQTPTFGIVWPHCALDTWICVSVTKPRSQKIGGCLTLHQPNLLSMSKTRYSKLCWSSPQYLSNTWSTSAMLLPESSVGKVSTCNAGDPSSTPRLGKSPGERIGYPLQYSWEIGRASCRERVFSRV